LPSTTTVSSLSARILPFQVAYIVVPFEQGAAGLRLFAAS
jgi:hypothetical protein